MKMYWYNTVDNLYKQDKTKFLKLVELKAQIIRDRRKNNSKKK